ncbi:Uma2 family endonuclease [Pleurocapsa sp. CCALA 161]|uniref:Uma2 family endonuclease n=1 Tax=Pleurocapsa sp. CCALA 161 TaxID=2107688 RepID=UPI001E5349F4|nr:Uma2 family endonuclease [Pleurocapsa sp. CCALA 161]
MEKYQKLGVKEVWFWISDRLEIYVLIDDSYQRQNSSYNLSKLDDKILEKYICQVLTGNPRLLKKAFLQEIS